MILSKATGFATLLLTILAGAVASAAPPVTDALTAIAQPDKASWQLFAYVVSPVPAVPGKVLFETWASNEDTFKHQPVFPGASGPPACPLADGTVPSSPTVTPIASPKILNIPALQALAPPGLQPHVSPDGSEEVRRNQVTFDFIICNDLYERAGLKAAFASGKPISFPHDAIEIKANWTDVANLSDPTDYYVSEAPDHTKYALVALHIISKTLPNWTWATFEHRANLGRCDFAGCHDAFGAVVANVEANGSLGLPYNPCTKTDELKGLFSSMGLPPVWENYCLKGSQVDFVTATGVPTILGNSVTEAGFEDTSSCISCHARAAVTAQGIKTTSAGFLQPTVPALCPRSPPNSCSPNGAPNPLWFWMNPGKPDPTMTAMQTDFIWSIARLALP